MKSIVEQVQDEIRFCKSIYNSCIKIKECFDINTGKNLFIIKTDYLNDCSRVYYDNIQKQVEDILCRYGYNNITPSQIKEINTIVMEALHKSI